MAKIYGQLEKAQLENIATASRPASPALGYAYFDTTTGRATVWNGASWDSLSIDVETSKYSRSVDTSDDLLDSDWVVLVKLSDAGITLTLPAPDISIRILIVDANGLSDTYPITIAQNDAEDIGGLASSYLLEQPYGSIEITSDGTDWFIS